MAKPSFIESKNLGSGAGGLALQMQRRRRPQRGARMQEQQDEEKGKRYSIHHAYRWLEAIQAKDVAEAA
jgi:hypothetical protein